LAHCLTTLSGSNQLLPVHIGVKHLFQSFFSIIGTPDASQSSSFHDSSSRFFPIVNLLMTLVPYDMVQTCNKLNTLLYSARIATGLR